MIPCFLVASLATFTAFSTASAPLLKSAALFSEPVGASSCRRTSA
jgi:hypothetical protein